MKLQIAPYNNTAGTWAEAEEVKFRSYTLSHRFNRPAEATIVLADVDGAMLRKYNADDDDVYIGAGKVTIEDPNGTDIFYGRIVRALGNFSDRTLTLECKDWLDQLDDELITYDMREKLGTTDMRQSVARSDVDGTRLAVEDAGGGVYNFYDDGAYDDDGGMAFVNDAYNAYKLVFTTGMAGTKTWTFHPYDSTATDHDIYGDDPETLWVDNDTLDSGLANNDWTLQYDFQVELGHNTPSDFYVHDSIVAAEIEVVYRVSGAGNHSHIQFYDHNAAAVRDIHLLEVEDLFHRDIIKLAADEFIYLVDADGKAHIVFDNDRAGGNCTLEVKYLALRVTTTTTGYATAVTINDTVNPNKLVVATDLTAAATQMWEYVPYCVVKPIYLHMESATGLIGGGDTVVTLTYGAGDIENTTGISTTQFKNKSRLDMMKALAEQDKATFRIELGTSTVTYQKTFGAHTVNISDATVDDFQSVYDYATLINSCRVFGARIGDAEINQLAEHAVSIAKFRTAKSKVITSAGIVSDTEAFDLAAVVAQKNAVILQMLSCSITGNTATAAHATTVKLGDVVGVTSSYLWSTAEVEYVVVSWAYDSKEHVTRLLLHPRSSIGFMDIETPDAQMQRVITTGKKVIEEAVIPDPVTHEVA